MHLSLKWHFTLINLSMCPYNDRHPSCAVNTDPHRGLFQFASLTPQMGSPVTNCSHNKHALSVSGYGGDNILAVRCGEVWCDEVWWDEVVVMVLVLLLSQLWWWCCSSGVWRCLFTTQSIIPVDPPDDMTATVAPRGGCTWGLVICEVGGVTGLPLLGRTVTGYVVAHARANKHTLTHTTTLANTHANTHTRMEWVCGE